MSDEILAAFAAESNEILEGIEDSIRGLEGGEAEALGSLFRLVHTLKGSASIVGLSRLESFAHAWETRLGKLRSGVAAYGPACAGAFLACRDRVARLLESARPADSTTRMSPELSSISMSAGKRRASTSPELSVTRTTRAPSIVTSPLESVTCTGRSAGTSTVRSSVA